MGRRRYAPDFRRDLGMETFNARHVSAAFKLTRPFATTVLANRTAFWTHEQLAIRLNPGMDEVSLALVADAWSRTYRSSAFTYAPSGAAVITANGLRVLPDRADADQPEELRASPFPDRRPAVALDRALQAISERYGERTTNVVAMQLEYPRQERPR